MKATNNLPLHPLSPNGEYKILSKQKKCKAIFFSVCFSFMSQDPWTSHLCIPRLLQQHWTEETTPTARGWLGWTGRQMGRKFLKRKAEQSSRSSFPWQQRFVQCIQVAKEDDDKRFKILDLFRMPYTFWSPRQSGCKTRWAANLTSRPLEGKVTKPLLTPPKHSCCFEVLLEVFQNT